MEFTQSVGLAHNIKLVVAAFWDLFMGFVGGMVGLAVCCSRLILVCWAANSPVNAAGTNIPISCLASTTGTWQHFREGRIDCRVIALIWLDYTQL